MKKTVGGQDLAVQQGEGINIVKLGDKGIIVSRKKKKSKNRDFKGCQ